MRKKQPGIFCLEGDWSPRLTQELRIRKLLEFLASSGKIKLVYRDVGTPSDLEFYARKWGQHAYDNYKIGYFAFHGSPGGIHIGRRFLKLDQLAKALAGSCAGKVIYFGSCATLKVSTRKIQEFRAATRAKCVCGYTDDVGWFESAAFELLLFDALTWYRRIDAAERYLSDYRGLQRRLGFRLYK